MITLEQAIAKYGPIDPPNWVYEERFMTTMGIPTEIGLNWINSVTGHPTGGIYCNIDMETPLFHALYNVRDRGLLSQLRTYDGCFNIRKVRGGDKLSCHGFGLAIDINAETNKLGTDGDITEELAKCFTDVGFIWGKEFGRKDPMHFTLGW